MPIPMYPVNSSQISYIGYEEENKYLFVTFKNGSTYRYEDVPKSEFIALRDSSSVGSYFITYVKNTYKFTKIK